MRYVCLDVGERRIGVATADDEIGIAFPKEVIERRGNLAADVDRVMAACREHEVEAIVVGLPLNADGGETEQSRRIRDFVGHLALPIHFQNEAFTTQKAETAQIEAGVSRKKRTTSGDSVAASIILQEFLNETTPS